MGKFFKLLLGFQTSLDKARQIKCDPVKKDKSVRFAVLSIILALCAVGFAALTSVFFLWYQSGNIVLIIAGVIVGLGIGLCGAIVLLGNSIKYWAMQCYINKKVMTWISLVVLILAVVASVVIVLYILGMF